MKKEKNFRQEKSLKSIFLSLIIGLTLASGVTFAWNAVWHGTDWIKSGDVIKAKEIAENFEYLYKRTNPLPAENCNEGDTLKWSGGKFICYNPNGSNDIVNVEVERGYTRNLTTSGVNLGKPGKDFSYAEVKFGTSYDNYTGGGGDGGDGFGGLGHSSYHESLSINAFVYKHNNTPMISIVYNKNGRKGYVKRIITNKKACIDGGRNTKDFCYNLSSGNVILSSNTNYLQPAELEYNKYIIRR